MADSTGTTTEPVEGGVTPPEAGTPEDTSGLKSALEKERADRKAAEKEAKDLRVKADKLDELEAAKQIAEEKLTDRATTAEGRAAALELDALRYRIALEVGLPADLAARLQGNDEDELKADAETLKNFVAADDGGGPAPRPRPDLSQGGSGVTPDGSTADQFAAAMNGRLQR